MPDKVGQQIGHYRLVRLLGSGGFAEVYLGEHLRLKTFAAIKLLHTSLEDDDVEGFLREAQTVARLRHPHIVRVFDFDVENRNPFLVMDYLPNGNVRRFHPKGSPLPLSTIVSYVTQVASALQYAHDEKLIHRDIKPENMLLDRDNTLVLSDFGIAIMAQSSRYQSTQQVAGTAAYMAPEQFQGKPRRASDQYALGIVVYEWLTGERPFHGSFTETASQHLFVPPPPLREKVSTISPDVEQVVLTTLAKDPDQRFGSVQAFANALEQASRSRSPELVQQTSPDPPMTAGSFQSARLPNQTSSMTSSFQQSQPQPPIGQLHKERLQEPAPLELPPTEQEPAGQLHRPRPQEQTTPEREQPDTPRPSSRQDALMTAQPIPPGIHYWFIQRPWLGTTIGLGVLVLLVVIGSFSGVFHVGGSNGANSSATATAATATASTLQINVLATANAGATAQAATTASAATSSSLPVITSVSPFSATQNQTITISGSGFGTHAPFTNATTLYLAINDVTDSDWEAGYGYDWVTVNVSVWNDSEIVITGFAGYYGQDGFVYRVGDTVTISVWNAQSSGGGNCPSGGCAGAATFNLVVAS